MDQKVIIRNEEQKDRAVVEKITRQAFYNLYVPGCGEHYLVHIMREQDVYKRQIHMLLSIPPKLSVGEFMGYLKGKSTLMIFERHANLKYKYGRRVFWAKGYYVSTVGGNKKAIQKYIQEQEREDQIMDQLSFKEYEDPFKDLEDM